ADARYGAKTLEAIPQHALPGCREAVRPTPLLRRQRLDPLARLEPGDGTVECPRSEPLSRHGLDVLRHGVAVLRPIGERDQDVQRRLGEPSQPGQQIVAAPHRLSPIRYYARHSITPCVVMSSRGP